MSNAAIAAALCLLATCPVASADSGGCLYLKAGREITVSVDDLKSKYLCTRDGKIITMVTVSNSQNWSAQIVAPFTQIKLTNKGEGGEAVVSAQSRATTYTVRISP